MGPGGFRGLNGGRCLTKRYSERDFFYDPGLNGVNLDELKKQYEPYLSSVAHRSDLNYLFREMLNQMTVGHMFIGGGDLPIPDGRRRRTTWLRCRS